MNPVRLVSFLAVLLVSASNASAHAHLDHASPQVDSVVNGSPGEVRMWFTESLEPNFSTAELRSSSGAVIGTGRVDPRNPQEMVIQAGALQPGKYKVMWKVVSVDTHRTEGSFGFEVKP
jgi:copper resistance protein C